MFRSITLVFLASLAACATVPLKEGTALAEAAPTSGLTRTVVFDHGCQAERIRFLRDDNMGTIDLDVCGTVRRYKVFPAPGYFPTYLDVTSLYPASSLPPPLSK